jgi:DNA-binding transcriptional MerR regulator
MTYKISEAAKMLRVSSGSLRRWERSGFICQVGRRPTNHREYTDADIEAIKEFLSKKNLTK